MNVSVEENNTSNLLLGSYADVELNTMHESLYGGTWGKIVYYFMIFICYIVGPILHLGIIIFETFGGDPQKRNVINRLMSLCCANMIFVMSVNGVCRVWRDLFGLIDVQIMIWIDWICRIPILSVLFSFNQMTFFCGFCTLLCGNG